MLNYKNSLQRNENLLKDYSRLPSGHPSWVCFFIRIDLEKCSITSLAHQWILCSEWVPSERESKQLIKTSQVIYTTPVHQLTSLEVKRCSVMTTLRGIVMVMYMTMLIYFGLGRIDLLHCCCGRAYTETCNANTSKTCCCEHVRNIAAANITYMK